VVAASALPETLPKSHRRSAQPRDILGTYVGLLRDRVFVGYAVTIGLAFSVTFAYISGSPFVFQQHYGLSASDYGFVFALNGIGLVLAGQLNGRLVSRFAPRTLLRTGPTLSLTGAAGLVVAAALRAESPILLLPLLVPVCAVGGGAPGAHTVALR